MSHELETFANGETAFVSAREDAWHKLGTVLPDVFTAEDALRVAHLGGWNVRKTAASTKVGGRTMRIPGCYATVRDNPVTNEPNVLGYVGDGYVPVQNEEHCEFLNTLADESGAHFETAGSLRDGRNVFVTMKLPNTMTVAGVDNLDVYIAGLNSHDGTSSFQVIVTPVRVVCKNTQSYALRAAHSRVSIRHTRNAKSKIDEARRTLGLTFTYLEEFQTEAERMMDAQLAEDEFLSIVGQLWPVDPESKRGQTIASARNETVLGLFHNDGATTADIAGTRWAGLQSVTEYLDHFAPARGDDAARARAERILVGSNPIRQTAHDLFAVPA